MCSIINDSLNNDSSLESSEKNTFQAHANNINNFTHETLTINCHALEELADSLKKLPYLKRYQSTLEILKNTEKALIPILIEKLEPKKGIRDAVIDFLYEQILLEGETPYSDQEVKQMFPPSKSLIFFPKFEQGEFLADDLHYSVLAQKEGCIDFELLKKNQLSTSGLFFFGYRYPTTLLSLIEMLEVYNGSEEGDKKICRGFWMHNGSLTKGEKDHIEGDFARLITLGYYYQQGFGTIDSDLGRGAVQVEQDIPQLHLAIEKLFENSHLARMPSGLLRRLLTETWGCNKNDQDLIAQIRLDAVLLEHLPGFYPIRVEIHNLPSPAVLQKIQKYVREHQQELAPADQDRLKALISRIEVFLGVSVNHESLPEGTWHELTHLRQTNKNGPETIEKYLNDRKYRDESLRKGCLELQKLKEIDSKSVSFENAITLTKSIIDQVVLDDMLPPDAANQYIQELDSILNDEEIKIKRKIKMTQTLLGNLIDTVHEILSSNFAKSDDILYLITRQQHRPAKFIDSLLRSNNIFLVGQLVDYFSDLSLSIKQITHCIDGNYSTEAVEIYNLGRGEGILRLDKDPMKMKSDEIGVFSVTPYEMTPVAGIITRESQARLSHLQLLAKALKIPSLKVTSSIFERLKNLEGKQVQLLASKEGSLTIIDASHAPHSLETSAQEVIEVPQPDLSVRSPIAFSKINKQNQKIAGPKGIQLAKMFNSKELSSAVPNGFIIPFGFFDKYIKGIGIVQQLEDITSLTIDQGDKVVEIANEVKNEILNNPLPQEMLHEVEKAIEELQKQMGLQADLEIKSDTDELLIHQLKCMLELDLEKNLKIALREELEKLQKPTAPQAGFFFRSDTNIEDLPNFNGAGLNKTIPHVMKNPEDIDLAIRKVWSSAFKEKSLYWRTKALSSDKFVLAFPSIVVMSTVEAESSGVLVAKTGSEKFSINANWGIGSVVEATKAVEEIVVESQVPHRLGFTVSSVQPVPSSKGGLMMKQITSNKPVLSDDDISNLMRTSKSVESVLGNQPNGWDIEWAFDKDHRLRVLQARPNM